MQQHALYRPLQNPGLHPHWMTMTRSSMGFNRYCHCHETTSCTVNCDVNNIHVQNARWLTGQHGGHSLQIFINYYRNECFPASTPRKKIVCNRMQLRTIIRPLHTIVICSQDMLVCRLHAGCILLHLIVCTMQAACIPSVPRRNTV